MIKEKTRLKAIFVVIIMVITTVSCNKKLDQNNMFQGREKTNSKKGHYDTGVRRNKPMSVQYAEEAQKENKDAANIKKLRREAEKELRQKKKKMAKHNSQFKDDSKYKLNKSKGEPDGGGQ